MKPCQVVYLYLLLFVELLNCYDLWCPSWHSVQSLRYVCSCLLCDRFTLFLMNNVVVYKCLCREGAETQKIVFTGAYQCYNVTPVQRAMGIYVQIILLHHKYDNNNN